MPIYIKYEGIKGEVTAQGYKGWIEVYSLQWGIGRGISIGTGGGSKREASAPSISEMVVTKTVDAADPLLLKEAIGGDARTVMIDITETDRAGSNVAFQRYKLERTLISSYALSSTGERPSVSFTLNFARFDSEYLDIDDKFAAKSTGHVIYDIAEARSG
jgi:type VI secretion system secreted protein Hcp